MNIRKIDTHQVVVNHRGDWIFVTIETDEGLTGIGEASHSGNDKRLCGVVEEMGYLLTGLDPLRINEVTAALRRPNGGRVHNTALSAIEQALWDLLGQHSNLPIRTLFGGAVRDRLKVYANINRAITDRSPEGFAAMAVQAASEGYTNVKIAPFDEVVSPGRARTGSGAAFLPGLERIRAVNEALGTGVEIAIDCHGRFEPSEAIQVAQKLEDLDLFWYEEPVPAVYPDNLKLVSRSVTQPIASCENLFGLESFKPFIEDRIVDVLMPDVKHDGGLMETKIIAEAARMSQQLVAPHNPAGPVATAATAQVISTVANFSVLEYAYGEVSWRAELLDPPEQIENGFLLLPVGPGLGHTLNRKVLGRHRHNESIGQ